MDVQAYKDEIGRRLRAVRHQQELTLDEVEIRTDGRFTAVTVGSWERGDRTISAPKLLRLAAFYGVPPQRTAVRSRPVVRALVSTCGSW